MPNQTFLFPLPEQVRRRIRALPPGTPRAFSSKLIDPDVVTANEGGELTAEQRAKFNLMQPGLGIVFMSFAISCGMALLPLIVIYSTVSKVLHNPSRSFSNFTRPPSSIEMFFYIAIAFFALAAAVSTVRGIYLLRKYMRSRSVLNRGAVRQADGVIQQSGIKYIAYFPEDKIPLRVWNDAEIDVVIPGRHQFFYLPFQGVNWLLSIKPYPADGEALRNLFAVLVNANGFDGEALEANRRGLLSQNQIYGSKIALSPELAAGRIEMAEGLAQKVLAMRLPSKEKFVGAAKEMLAEAAFDIAADVALAAVFGSGGSSSSSDNSSSGDDDEDDGQEENMFIQCAYEIQGIRFPVSRESYDALIEGVRYRAYYLPQSKVLVNIEPLSYAAA